MVGVTRYGQAAEDRRRHPMCGTITCTPGDRLWVCTRPRHDGSPASAIRHTFRRLLVVGAR